MLWPGLKKLGKELGLKRTNSEIVGTLKNCFVKMFDGTNMKVLEIFSPQMDDADKARIESILKENKVKKHDWLDNGVRIVFYEHFRPYSTVKIRNLLNVLVEYFSQKYPDNLPQCQNCGIQKEAEAYSIGNESKYICGDCLKKLEKNINNEYWEYKELPANYLSGFIGALLFAIPGVIVTILFFVFLNRLAAVSTLVYIALGIKGYKLFKGKITPLGAFIVIIVGLIMIGVGTIAAYSILIFKEIKTIDMDLLKQILKMPEVEKELRTNIILSYVVSSFFIVFQLFQMTKEWRFLKKIQKAREI
jgi:hypothetical protein